MKPGDILLNTSAGKRNPQRYSMFLRNNGSYIICVDCKGDEVRFYSNDQRLKNSLHVVDHCDFTQQIKDTQVEVDMEIEGDE